MTTSTTQANVAEGCYVKLEFNPTCQQHLELINRLCEQLEGQINNLQVETICGDDDWHIVGEEIQTSAQFKRATDEIKFE